MRPVLRADAWIRDRLQAVYDRLLDRHGIYLGTVRAVCCALTWVFIGLTFYVTGVMMGHPLSGVFAMAIYLAVLLGFLWRSDMTEHLIKDWNDQNEGRYERINARAETKRGGHALFVRVIVLVCVGGGESWSNLDEPAKLPFIALATVSGLLWAWSLELKVRARRDTSPAHVPEFAR